MTSSGVKISMLDKLAIVSKFNSKWPILLVLCKTKKMNIGIGDNSTGLLSSFVSQWKAFRYLSEESLISFYNEIDGLWVYIKNNNTQQIFDLILFLLRLLGDRFIFHLLIFTVNFFIVKKNSLFTMVNSTVRKH